MEDRHVIAEELGKNKELFLAGVFDGHGGSSVSDYLSQNFHHIFNSVYTSGELETIFDCIEVTLYICDKNVEAMNIPNEGSTVVTAFFYRDSNGLHLTVANCGDSRAVLSQNNTAIRLSYDHKASDENERVRIENKGGVVLRDRVLGIVAVSRSVGDHYYKDYIISRPHIHDEILSAGDQFLVLSSDGIFDVLSDQQVVDFVSKCIEEGHKEDCADLLLRHAIEYGASDNLTAIVIGF